MWYCEAGVPHRVGPEHPYRCMMVFNDVETKEARSIGLETGSMGAFHLGELGRVEGDFRTPVLGRMRQ